MAFIIDPVSMEATPLEMIGSRSDFLFGPAKRVDLVNFALSGRWGQRQGGSRNGDGSAALYARLSGAEGGWGRIPDPFASRQTFFPGELESGSAVIVYPIGVKGCITVARNGQSPAPDLVTNFRGRPESN